MLVDQRYCGNENPDIILYKNKEDALNEFYSRLNTYKNIIKNQKETKLLSEELVEEYVDHNEDEYNSGLPTATFEGLVIDYKEHWHLYITAKKLN